MMSSKNQKSIKVALTIFIIVLIIVGGRGILYGRSTVLSSVKKEKVLASKITTASKWRTFTSNEGQYSVTYPGNWFPDVLSGQLKGFSGVVPVFTTGPVGKKFVGYPSYIQIAVDENGQQVSLDEFISQKYGNTVSFTSQTVGSESAKVTMDIQGPVENQTILVNHNGKIYQIRFFNGAEPKISLDEFAQFLSRFTFL